MIRAEPELLEQLFELSPSMLGISALDGRLQRANSSLAGFLASTPAELVGRELFEFFHPDDQAPARCALQQGLVRGVAAIRGVGRLARPNGAAAVEWTVFPAVPAQCSLIAVRAVDDPASSLVGQLEQHNFRRIIIERAAEGLCVCHPIADFPFVRFTVWNPRMTELTGYTMEEINRTGWYQTLYPDPEVQKRAMARMAIMREGVDLVGEEWEITRNGGEKRTVSISTSILKVRDDQVHVMALMHDLTDKKRAEAERMHLEAQIRQAQKLESIGILAGGIAHDFNNLLIGVLGSADLAMLETDETSTVHPYLSDIKRSALHMADLTSQLLAYAGRGKYVLQAINVSRVVVEMAHLLERLIPKSAVISYDLDHHVPAVAADVGQLRQVIMNLMINAFEAIGAASGVISLRTGTRVIDASPETGAFNLVGEPLLPGVYVLVEVADTGSGMDATTREKIFDPFFTTKTNGRGLGLAAVLGIMHGHKGAINVSSAPHRGTTFQLLFPCAGEQVAEATAPAAKEIFHRGHGTILLVDDEESVGVVVKAMLQRAGYEVLVATDGLQAVEAVRQRPAQFRAVLLDLTMPRMGGIEAHAEIRRLREDLPVVLCSGYTRQEAVDHFAGQGVAEFLHKPFELRTLTETLSRVLEGRPQPVTGD